MANRVMFLGSKPQPEIVALLREADLFVLPSKEAKSGDRDGLPNVIMEAASQGLAIVATDFAGIPEFIRSGVEGELVPPGDWEALSNALNLLARDPDRREALGAAAYRAPAAGVFHGGRHRRARSALPVPDGRPKARTGDGCDHREARCLLCPVEEPEPSPPLGRPHHGASSDEGSRPGGLCAATCQRDANARQSRRSAASGGYPAAIACRGLAPDRALSSPSGRATSLPLVHLSRLLQGAGLDRSARRRRPRHPLCHCRRLPGLEARERILGSRPRGRRGCPRPCRCDLRDDGT